MINFLVKFILKILFYFPIIEKIEGYEAEKEGYEYISADLVDILK